MLTSARFGTSSLHQRDSRSALFDGYTAEQPRRQASASPASGPGYGYGAYGGYPGGTASHNLGVESKGYRAATPNRKGQYSDAVLNELESQNDAQVEGILGKVRTLKDVSGRFYFPPCLVLCAGLTLLVCRADDGGDRR